MIRILVVDRDDVRLEQTRLYLQSFEEFKVTASQYDDEAADELANADFDTILYTMSDKSDPELLFDEESDFSSILLIMGTNYDKNIFRKNHRIKIKNIENFENNNADLAEIIRTSYTLHSIEDTISRSINKYKLLFLKAPVPFAILNDSGKIIDVNYEWAKNLEYQRNELSGCKIYEFIQEEDAENIKKILLSTIKSYSSGRQAGTGVVMLKKSGASFPARLFCSEIYDETEKSDRILCTFADITSQNTFIKSLNFKSRIFDAVGSCMPSLLHSKSVNEDIQNILHIFGIALDASRVSIFFRNNKENKDKIYSKKFEWISPESKSCQDISEILNVPYISEILDNYNILKAMKKPAIFISGNTEKNIQKILDKCGILSLLCVPVSLDENKNAVMLIENCNTKREWESDEADAIIITTRILGMILRLKHIELKSLAIIEDSPDLTGIINKDGLIIYSNNAVTKFCRLCRNEIYNNNIADIFQKDASGRLKLQIKKTIEEKKPVTENYSLFYQNNEYRINLLMYPVKSEFGIKNVIFFGRDITERTDFEDRLLLTQFAVESSPDSIYYTDKTGNIIYANKAACSLVNYSKDNFLKLSLSDLNPKCSLEIWKKHWNELKLKGTLKYKTIHRKSDGTEISVEIVKNYLNFSGKELSCSYIRDISERKNFKKF